MGNAVTIRLFFNFLSPRLYSLRYCALQNLLVLASELALTPRSKSRRGRQQSLNLRMAWILYDLIHYAGDTLSDRETTCKSEGRSIRENPYCNREKALEMVVPDHLHTMWK